MPQICCKDKQSRATHRASKQPLQKANTITNQAATNPTSKKANQQPPKNHSQTLKHQSLKKHPTLTTFKTTHQKYKHQTRKKTEQHSCFRFNTFCCAAEVSALTMLEYGVIHQCQRGDVLHDGHDWAWSYNKKKQK